MAHELTPKSAAYLANSPYAFYETGKLSEAAILAGNASQEFNIAGGSPLTGVTGLSVPGGAVRTGFGYIAHGKGSRAGEMLVAVRGTQEGRDWLTNAHMSGKPGPSGRPVHEGFCNTANSILAQLRPMLQSATNRPSCIHIVGHSLGGAVATIIADALHGSQTVKLYTFGAPRAGTLAHSLYLTRSLGAHNIFRVYHDTDIVPMVPIFPFVHVPTSTDGYMLRGVGTLVSIAAHSMTNYQKSVGEKSWRALPTLAHRPMSLDTVDDWLSAASAYSGPFMGSVVAMRLIVASLDLILSSIIGAAGLALFGAATALDRMAYFLMQGMAASKKIADSIVSLIKAIMRFTGRAIVAAGTKITEVIIRAVLQSLFSFIANMARRAVTHIM